MGKDWRPSPQARKVLREFAGLHDEAEVYGNPISLVPNPLERRLASASIKLAERIAALEAENARLREDGERLDWLEQASGQDIVELGCDWEDDGYSSIRKAIDAARKGDTND